MSPTPDLEPGYHLIWRFLRASGKRKQRNEHYARFNGSSWHTNHWLNVLCNSEPKIIASLYGSRKKT